MALSPTSSHVYVNFTSLFAQDGRKTLSSFQAATSQYANGAFQVRNASTMTLDILDLSPEALAAADSSKTKTETTAESTSDTVLQASELTEQERVEMIRVNKNAVLERVNTLLEEKGIDVPKDMPFELKVNFMDGTISVSGIEDPELAASVNEALAGDEELIDRMRKTREELGLPEQENTVPRNFTIQFASMQETPVDAEIEFKIDLFINQPENDVPVTEEAEAAEGESGESKNLLPAPLHLSIVLTNKIKAETGLLDQLDKSTEKARKEKTEEAEKEERDEKTGEIDEENDVAAIGTESETGEAQASGEIRNENFLAWLGSFFQADSHVSTDPTGLTLEWSLQFSNWDISASMDDPASAQRIYETLHLGGTTRYAYDAESSLPVDEQADRLRMTFAEEMTALFSSSSDWGREFLAQNGLGALESLS